MKKSIIIITTLFIFILSVLLIGCEIKVDPETGVGSITGELTKLTTPTNICVENDKIKWSAVSNAGSYLVQIGDASHQAVTTRLEYPISSILSASASGLYVMVKALPSSSLLFSESDWSEPFGPIEYATTAGGFEEKYLNNSLGRAIDLINGTAYEPMAGAVSIFDMTKLYKNGSNIYNIGRQNAWCCSGNDFEEISNKWALNLEKKLSIGTGVKSGNFLSASLNFGIDFKSGYEVEKESETTEFFYKLYQYIIGTRVEIDEYRNTEAIAQMLSEQFLNDAQKVNIGAMSAESFVNKYGTHVIMSAYYGGVIEATYYSIEHKAEANLNWYANLENTLTQHLSVGFDDASIGGGSESSSAIDYSQFNKIKTGKRMAEFNATALGGSGQSFASMEAFAKSYSDWAKSVNKNTYSLIDIPDGGLYCIWDYLDDSYNNAKNILDEYLISRCDEEYNKIHNKIASIKSKDNVKFRDNDNTLVIDLKEFQEKGNLDNFDFEWYKNGVLTIYPQFNGQEIKNIELIGAYNTRNNKGTIIYTLISNFSMVFHEDWYSDINLTLESVGVNAKNGMTVFNFQKVKSEYAVNINILGTNKLIGSNSADNASPKPAINASNITISSAMDNAILYCYGGKGKDGANGKDQNLDDRSGGKVPNTQTTSGKNGQIGAIAIDCKKLTVLGIAKVNLIGGNGGHGGNGGNVCNGGYYDGYADLPDGGAGGNGGDGGAPISSGTPISISSTASLLLQFGNGGNGGNGGQGGSAVQPSGANGSKPDGWGHGGQAGKGGSGYVGGNAGTGGNGGNSFSNYRNTKVQKQYGTTGNGGECNDGGNAKERIIIFNGIITKESGEVGKGGTGGQRGKESWSSIGAGATHLGEDKSEKVGKNGKKESVSYSITIK